MKRLTDAQLRALLDLMMVSDPWPDGVDRASIEELINADSQERGWSSWIVAYHEMPQWNPEELLIAAAPDLLEALEGIMEYAGIGASVCDIDTSEQPQFVKARKALAKARGKP